MKLEIKTDTEGLIKLLKFLNSEENEASVVENGEYAKDRFKISAPAFRLEKIISFEKDFMQRPTEGSTHHYQKIEELIQGYEITIISLPLKNST